MNKKFYVFTEGIGVLQGEKFYLKDIGNFWEECKQVARLFDKIEIDCYVKLLNKRSWYRISFTEIQVEQI